MQGNMLCSFFATFCHLDWAYLFTKIKSNGYIFYIFKDTKSEMNEPRSEGSVSQHGTIEISVNNKGNLCYLIEKVLRFLVKM